MSDARDSQVGGDHYTRYPIQPWDAMAVWFTRDEFLGFLRRSSRSCGRLRIRHSRSTGG